MLLWPDTFSNFFDPQVAQAAVAAFDHLGYRVEVPRQAVCCGLPWMFAGQVGVARWVLRHSVRVLRPWLDAGVPIVGLEPSCTAMLRADVLELLPDDPGAARRAGAVRSFAEVLNDHPPAACPSRLGRRRRWPSSCTATSTLRAGGQLRVHVGPFGRFAHGVADGFSCRTQVRQGGGAEPVHLAQLAARAWNLDIAR